MDTCLGGASMKRGVHAEDTSFREALYATLRASGYTYRELAKELSLHPKVLSRKLHGTENAHLNQQEIQQIISILADWRAITTRGEAFRLLTLAQVDPAIISAEEWKALALYDEETHLHNLPAQQMRLIGRERAARQLRNLLLRDEVRLVTLLGTGGCGKTSLALHVGRGFLGTFTHGVWFVSLAGQDNPAQVPMSIIQALNIMAMNGTSPLESLIAYLRNKHLLLILDNFEQVSDAAICIGELLDKAPALKAVVTSRAVLKLHGEHEFSVLPLAVPDIEHMPTAEELAQYPSIQLFVERAQEKISNFVLSDTNAATIARICNYVDGLPLALELAAARIKVLPPTTMLERLSKGRLPVLTGGARNLPDRHRALRDTIAWSYELLSPVERRWFHRLGVFRGNWPLEAAEAMMQSLPVDTPASISALDLLEQLVNNSLLTSLPGEYARFTMLETLREYALERLAALEETELTRDWHACYYLKLAENAEYGLRGPQQLHWLTRLTEERENFRTALEWSLQRARDGMSIRICLPLEHTLQDTRSSGNTSISAAEVYLRLAAALRPYWEWQGRQIEGRYWLGAAIELPLEDCLETPLRRARAKAISEIGRLIFLQNDLLRAIELVDESITLWRRLDDAEGLATALLYRGWIAHACDQYEDAKVFYLEGLQQIASTGNTWLRAHLLFSLGSAYGFTSDYQRMRALYDESRALFERLDDRSAVADTWKDQGGLLILQGQFIEGIDCVLKSLTICLQLDHKQYIATGLGLLSFAFGLCGKPDEAQSSFNSAMMQGASEGLMEAIGFTPWTRNKENIQAIRLFIRGRVGEEAFRDAMIKGRQLSIKQAIELAIQLRATLDA